MNFSHALQDLLGIKPATIQPEYPPIPTAAHFKMAREFYRWRHGLEPREILTLAQEQDGEILEMARALAITTGSE